MNLAEIIQNIYTLTNRPDLVEQTLQHALSATIRMHCVELFPRDIIQMQVNFETAAYIQELDIYALPRFRKFSFFRKYDPSLTPYQINPLLQPPLFLNTNGQVNSTNALRFLRPITPDDIFDNYGTEKYDVFYQAGTTVCMKSSTPLQYGIAGWFALPQADGFTPDNGVTYPRYVSWIATAKPFAIIYDAASKIFQATGQQDTSRKFDRPADPGNKSDEGGLVQQEIQALIRDYLIIEGN